MRPENVLDRYLSIDGDVAEIGVYRGGTLVKLLAVMEQRVLLLSTEEQQDDRPKFLWGFDSFKGMGPPGKHDHTNYPEGKFGNTSKDQVQAFLQRSQHRVPIILKQGFVPECFEKTPEDLEFCFAYIDLDHYQPTIDATNWIWPRLNVGGALLYDDFIPDQKCLASLALLEMLDWFNAERCLIEHSLETQRLLIQKTR